MSLEQQVYVLYAFIKPVHIVGIQYVFRKCITETVSMSKALPAQLCRTVALPAQLHQATSKHIIVIRHWEWKIGKVTGFSHEGPFPPLHLQSSCQPKRSKSQGNEKAGIARTGKSDFSSSSLHPYLMALPLLQGHTPPPTPSNNSCHLFTLMLDSCVW